MADTLQISLSPLKTRHKIRIWFTCLGFRYFTGFIKFWYGLSMLVTRHKKATLPEFLTTQQIAEMLRFGDGWRSDPFGGALDVLTHPTRIQWRLDNGKRKVEDCDGHAAYWCVALLKSGLAKRVWFSIYQMRKIDGRFGGHAVCVYEDQFGRLWWCDYGAPRMLEADLPIKALDGWEWAITSARGYKATPIAAAKLEVKLSKDKNGMRWTRGFQSKTDFPS